MSDRGIENYTIEELVQIGDHIHNCTTAIIIADIEEDGGHNVLITARGKRDDVVIMLIETMMKDSRVAEIVELAFINYVAKMEQSKNEN
ncbi:MAG: hypothetical protein WCI04_00310 [archaeon]